MKKKKKKQQRWGRIIQTVKLRTLRRVLGHPMTGGLYYKHMTIISDNSSVNNK
jgi:hypothetical protein